MKTVSLLLSIFLIVGVFSVKAQSTFTPTDYTNFLQQNASMTYDEAYSDYPLPQTYYKNSAAVNLYKYSYFDSLEQKYSITAAEKALIQKNGFMVTERLSYQTFKQAFDDVFHKDMPVFLSTDAVLFALHASYDNILKEMEEAVMSPNLTTVLDSLYSHYPVLKAKYQSYPELRVPLADIDLYVTVARSLIYAQVRPLIHPAQMGLAYGVAETASALAVMLAPLLAGVLYTQDPGRVYWVSAGMIARAMTRKVKAPLAMVLSEKGPRGFLSSWSGAGAGRGAACDG